MKKNLTLGIVIILIGVIWLLGNLDIFSFSYVNIFFRALGQLWPLILIGIGISILIKEKPLIKLIVWIIIILSVMAYGIYGYNANNRYQGDDAGDRLPRHTKTIMKDTGTKEGQLRLPYGAGDFSITSTDQGLLNFETNYDLKYDYRLENDSKMAVVDFTTANDNFITDYDFDKLYCKLALNTDVVWDMDIDLGAAQGSLDLTEIPVSHLDLGTGAADIDLYLGKQNKFTDVTIESGASDLDIHVPKDAGLKITLKSALTDNNLSDLGLIKDGDTYISPGFQTQSVQIVCDISMGVGSIKFYTD
ncbi:DUF5668 domain-containing protein [Dehalobacter sp. DCM]|uniref:LiaI-LiaF-like domain-containing protein n=1 Tax=Dehalobacter sp. DCM TaxID=2907827 RepID=UPI0030821E0C|nr:DUF5668 domain-containing protein [Dehalobacter sp. DCM]